MGVDCIIEDGRWADLGLETLAGAACGAVLAYCGLDPDAAEIGLLGCDDARIAGLNGDFRGKAVATNVLSWPGEERGADRPGGLPHPPADSELGDIAIAYDTCRREAEAAGLVIAAHVTHLLVHATLHLLGYDHIDDKDAALMEGIEIEILGKLGISDPYEG